jgi:hypothetical protein
MATPYGQPAPGGVPGPRKTSPLVWVLVAVLGFFVLCGIGALAIFGIVAHRVHQAVSVDHDGNVSIRARGGDGGSIVIGKGGKLPSWVPSYPGADAQATFAVKGGDGEGGNFTFKTSDAPSKVKEFYEDKCKDLGMKISLDTTTEDGGMVIATDDGGEKRSVTVVVGRSSGETTVNVTYGRK